MNLEQTVLQVPIEDIIPNRFQPRLNFDEQGLQELAASIKEHGVIQPLVLRKLGDKYEIIAGERRYKASQIAGLTTVPAVVANIDDNKSAEVALVENVQRRDLTAIEEARSYKNLLDKGYLTQDQLAKRMGLSQPAIANKLRLLNLDEEVQEALLTEKISERHARTLLQLEEKSAQREWLHKIINERLTVRQLDLELKKLKNGGYEEIPLVEEQPSIEDIKANAFDLNDTSRKMAAEDIMRPQQFVDEVVESLEDYDDKKIETTKVPDFQIATPASTNQFVPSKGLPTNNNNKFFDFNIPEETKDESTFISTGTPTPNREMEIFGESNPFIDFTKPESEPEIMPNKTIGPTDYTKDDLISPMLSSNNTFFKPVTESTVPEMINAQKEDIDPMDSVSNLTEKEDYEIAQATDLKAAITTIRECIQGLGDKGYYIDVEEIDFDREYQITIHIDKGDI